jgi:hypothetical protein
MSTARQNFFVYVTTTYVCSKKWDVVLNLGPNKFPSDSGTCSKKLTNDVVRGSYRKSKKEGGAGL